MADKSDQSGTKDDSKAKKDVFVPRSATEKQKLKLEKLMKNPQKQVVIPDRPEDKLPRVFNPPEFIRNIWGSSAGAGSGDFHVYRGVRRREYARQKFINEKADRDDLDKQFHEKVVQNKKEAEERTSKKKLKRQKKKQKQKQKCKKPKTEKKTEDDSDEEEEDDEDEENAPSES